MSGLSDGTDVEYSYCRVKILGCKNPGYWYADKVGQIVDAQKCTFIKDGKVEHVSYLASPDGKKNDWRGSLPLEVEEI